MMKALVLASTLALAACQETSALCVDTVLCVLGSHWDSSKCTCVSDGDAGAAGDLATSCSSSCAGGSIGCPSMCSGCTAGQLCCPWSGGPCMPTDGGCMGSGGFKCATATPAGQCPNQCFP